MSQHAGAPITMRALIADDHAGRDYTIRLQRRDSRIAIIAPHGGKIEWGTSQIAEAIAGETYRFFSFEGDMRSGNYDALHVTSTAYDEPNCMHLISTCETVVAIHGWDDVKRNKAPTVYLGGRDETLREEIGRELRKVTFSVAEFTDPTNEYRGELQNNICNRGKSGRGVQLEIPKSLRNTLIPRSGPRPAKCDDFVNAIKQAIQAVSPGR